MPPQHPSSRFRPSFAAASKKPSLLAAVSSPTKKIARPASAPSLAALSAAAAPSSKTTAPAKKVVRPMPSSGLTLATPFPAKPRGPPSSKIAGAAAAMTSASKKPARPAAPGPLAAANSAVESVHPARRLTCGTAVCVRTKYVLVTGRCCLLIWLPARVVSSSDAYHCTVKYAADLHAMYAGKVVRVSVDDVREAPHRAAAPPPRPT